MPIAHSTITLYNTNISQDKNMIVDSIATYLNDIVEKQVIDDFQFIKPSLVLTIKLNASQFDISPYDSYAFELNYVKIVNVDSAGATTKPLYYFIEDIKWISQNAIMLHLHLDVLNTFCSTWTESNVLDKQTKIKRATLKKYTQYNGGTDIKFNIPFLCDEIFPVKYLKNRWTLSDLKFPSNTKWYLIYKTRTSSEDLENRPVDCFIASDSDRIKIRTQTNPNLVYSNLTPTYLWILAKENDNNASITFIDKDGKERTINVNGNQTRAILIEKISDGADNYFKIGCYIYSKDAFGMYENQWESPFVKLEWRTAGATGTENEIRCNNITKIREGTGSIKYFEVDILALNSFNPNSVQSDYDLTPINSVDRTDTTILKIIELPYCPINLTTVAVLTYSTDDGFFDLTTGMIRLYDTSKKLEISFISSPSGASNIANQLHTSRTSFILSYPNKTLMNDTLWQDKDLEPMLKHSNYYSCKYVYDTFEKGFALEQLEYDTTYTYTQAFNIKFNVTTTINSRFMFNLGNNGFTYKLNELLYPDYLFIQRNNEITLYSSAFINYIRTGYNYDQKNRYLAVAQSGLNLGLDTIGKVGEALGQDNKFDMVGGLIGAGAGVIKGLSSIAFENIKSLMAIEQKQVATKYQGTSFNGADDLDLMNTYAGNKLHFVICETSPIMTKALHQLYFYTGYPQNYFDNALPHSNRYWFDFVQADIIFKRGYVSQYSKEIQIEIVQKYSEGVTYFHRRNNEYDFEQKYVNHDYDLI